YQSYCERIIKSLFEYLLNIYNNWNLDLKKYKNSSVPLDRRFGRYLGNMQNLYKEENSGTKSIVRDYIAGMTDSYALRCMKEISLPEELNFDRPSMEELR
ncbi:unnamed protein product, partial [marine sediment metagenome]